MVSFRGTGRPLPLSRSGDRTMSEMWFCIECQKGFPDWSEWTTHVCDMSSLQYDPNEWVIHPNTEDTHRIDEWNMCDICQEEYEKNRNMNRSYAQEQLDFLAEAKTCIVRHPNSQKFHDRLDALKALHDRKQKDYGTSDDPFANVRGVENLGIPAWVGVVMRIEDKMRRLQNAARQALEDGQVSLANESVEDSFDDLAVYAQIGAILFEEWSRNE